MTGLIILIIALCVLIAGLVLFNVFTSKRFKNTKKLDKINNAQIETVEDKKAKRPKKQEADKPNVSQKLEIEGLFNKKDEKKKGKTKCASCGSEVETYDGSGRCPYCGAKVVKK